jgi:hypothetical protein
MHFLTGVWVSSLGVFRGNGVLLLSFRPLSFGLVIEPMGTSGHDDLIPLLFV